VVREDGVRRQAGRLVFLGVVAVAGACGGASSGTTPTPTTTTTTPASTTPPTTLGPAPMTATITITERGATPRDVTIAVGGRVTFVNNDPNLAHDMTSDPHPAHTQCPQTNDVGLLRPGQTGSTAAYTVARFCDYHDHGQPDNRSLTGRITIR
jgi:plastocyanin